ncbi:conserved hypothetical protein [Lodderomyces elongisporus NRRL YB-4239]|uniref:MATE efflux family protein n=1 Tax=Lodderomyces elongisporus (strain ATCC 11503 / CBS 2605 / JCM 1781 / NBRC 1676 / NRRL YB-4239) TaxID=379508 RepID=A5E6J7_LODEL|nr:conserved hypothetical protein [Lodderomyces elongisporus NRRL YB-4239]
MSTEEALLIGAYRSYESCEQIVEPMKGVKNITYVTELKRLVQATIPLVITFFLQYAFSTTSMYFAGRLGPKELSACSIAICTFNMTGLAIFQGMATALDTFCSQAYGAGNLHGVGVYFQRACLIMLVTMIPLSFVWFNAGFILSLFVKDVEIVEMAQIFLKWHTLGVPAYILFEAGKRFLQAQHIFKAGTYVLLVSLPFNIYLNWLFVHNPSTSLGFTGIPLSIACTYWIITFTTLAYVVCIDGSQCWGGFTKRAFINWSPMIKLALPGVVMVISEYLAFEVMVFYAASFGTAALAAQSIVSSLVTLFYQPPFAYAVAISTRIGHSIGTRELKSAKITTNIFYLTAGIIGLTNLTIFIVGRHTLAKVFTSDKDVLKVAADLSILAGINQIGDTFNVVATGVLRGQGRQRIGSILNALAYYVVAIPLQYYLAFKTSIGLPGLWYGLIIAVGLLAMSQCFVIYRSNWDEIVETSDKMHDAQ